VAAVLGIPAVVAGLGAGYDHAIYSNVEQAREAAYEEFLIPIQRINAHDLAIQLLPDFTTDPRIRLQHDYSKVRALQEDQDGLAKRAVAAFAGGLMMRGEARELIGLKARPEDNVHFMPRSSGLIAPDEVLVPGAPTAETLQEALGGEPAPVPGATEPPVPPAEAPPAEEPPPAPSRARNGRKAQDAATISDADIADARAFWADDAVLAPFLEATVSTNGNGKH
jgi:hypothetical protein